MNGFNEIFRSKKSQNGFLGLKIFLGLKNWIFRAKKQLLGLYSVKNLRMTKKVAKKFGGAQKKKEHQKILGMPERKGCQKFGNKCPKNNNF